MGRLLVLFAGLLMFGVACGGGGGVAPGQAGTQGEAKPGGKLYVQKGCVACHGEMAAGNAAIGAPKTAGTQLTFEEVLKQVRTPRGTMPPFSPQQVTDEEIREILAYLTSLK